MKKIIRFTIALITIVVGSPVLIIVLSGIAFIVWVNDDEPDWDSFIDFFYTRNELRMWLTFK